MYSLNTKKVILSLVTLVGLFLSFPSITATPYSYDATNEKFWMTLGLGVAPEIKTTGHISLNCPICSNFLLTARSAGMSDHAFKIITLIGLLDGPEYVSDAGVLFGLLHNTDCFQLSAATGVAYVEGGKNASFFNNAYQYSTIGIPFEIQAFWKPIAHLGIGIVGFANVNSQRSFAGATLSLRLSF